MKHPFWLLNILLLLLLVITGGLILVTRQPKPRGASLKPETIGKPAKKDVSKIDLNKIIENDLFDTYKPAIQQPASDTFKKPAMPSPPTPQPVRVPLSLPPKFLEPLQIILKGIITLTDQEDNVAIIQDAKSTMAKNYRIGDILEDAQIVHITKTKIVLIRSNGQQETLYVTQKDAEIDQELIARSNWQSTVSQQSAYEYIVDPAKFIEVVPSLAHFIDLLNLTTVYKKGKSIGCRVGNMPPNSIGTALGLMPGDLITTINKKPITTTDERLIVYKEISQLELGHPISVELTRAGQHLHLTYIPNTLSDDSLSTKTTFTETGIGYKTPEMIEAEKIDLLKQRENFAPTLHEMRKNNRQMIKQHSNMPKRRGQNVLFNGT
jgi:type II secretion system protein C